MIAWLARVWRRLRCAHYYVHEASIPSAEGILRRRRCVRCEAVEHVHMSVRGRR